MINTQKLKGRIVEKGLSYQKLAKKVSCSAYTLGQKVLNRVDTTLEEAMILSDELDISDMEFKEFFLCYGCKNATKQEKGD